MRTPAERLIEAREAAGCETAAEAAERAGVKYYTYVQHESGTRGISKDKAAVYARAFGTDASWLLYGKRRPAPGRRTVPLVGYVGAGAEAHFYASADEGLDEVEAPDDATPDTRAAEVRGESLGPLFEHWLVFFDDVRTPVTSDLIGRLCIVGLPNDKVLVKKIQRSRTEGLFHLLSNNEAPMLDQEVLWAARVRSMTPR